MLIFSESEGETPWIRNENILCLQKELIANSIPLHKGKQGRPIQSNFRKKAGISTVMVHTSLWLRSVIGTRNSSHPFRKCDAQFKQNAT